MPGSNSAAHQRDYQTPNAQSEVKVTAKDLPLLCPLPGSSLWDSHPRVFLPIADTPDGRAECPYCGTRYLLEGGVTSSH